MTAGTYPTRKYAAAEGGFEWRVLRNFAVTATYSYRWQEYADEPVRSQCERLPHRLRVRTETSGLETMQQQPSIAHGPER